MNQISECCDAPLLYYVTPLDDGTVEYEQWDFCPSCLECCSGYDPSKRNDDKMNRITKGANNETITRAIKRLSEECGFGRKDHAFDREDDSVYNSGFYSPQECTP